MAVRKKAKPVGLLHYNLYKDRFQHRRYIPSGGPDLFVEHYWIVKWNFAEGEFHVQENIPHPSVHIIIEKDSAQIAGVMERKFKRVLENSGLVFGIKFKPGGFFPFVKFNISEITNKTISLNSIFGTDAKNLEMNILSAESDEKMVDIAENFIKNRLPDYDENLTIVQNIIDFTRDNRKIIKVEDIARRFDINIRTLQRMFGQYVGVSPKWIIKRFRLHEALELLENKSDSDLSGIALELGYFDQAHFIKDFKNIIGKPPSEYLKVKS